MTTKFTRKIEDFICGHCGAQVTGDGYTNHCPVCLYSKHVDIHPGDRAATCQGLMAPVEYLLKNGEEKLLHRCLVCGYEKLNRLDKADNRDLLLKIIATLK
jgi:rubrerythrin